MRRLLGLLVVLLVVGVPGVARGADGDRVALSLDGRTWSSSLDRPVLSDAPTTWVPGDVAAGRLWVRNDGPTAAALSLGTSGREGDALMADLQVTVRSGDRVATVRGAGTTKDDLGVLEPGQVTRVRVEVGIVASSRNRTQTERESVSLRVVLTEVVASEAGQGGAEGQDDADDEGAAPPIVDALGSTDPSTAGTAPLTGGPSGDLPGTGAPVGAWFVWAGALVLGTGAALASTRRREER
ncbi:hypothetical protein [Solicola sp. PLA-1-18]|uniref:hypothetical protein n=1 Tax=Solicola sp. PLA-1-18 TaxID=3380532 RepID=UPI003B80B7E5